MRVAASTGRWRLPDDRVPFDLGDGTKACGYYQCGVDVGPLLPGRKQHVLFGKTPPKDALQEDQFLFFKLEEHGNSGAMEAIRHGINYAESLRRKKSDQASSRTEKPSKKQRNWFMAIVDHAMLDTKPRLLASDHTGARLDAFTPCFTKDDFKLRAKALGFSFMHPVVCAIRDIPIFEGRA